MHVPLSNLAFCLVAIEERTSLRIIIIQSKLCSFSYLCGGLGSGPCFD